MSASLDLRKRRFEHDADRIPFGSFPTAHRVWTQFNSGIAVSATDLEILKQNARSEEHKFRIDLPALAIIQRELS
jgi:hypothetical protein